MKTPWQIKECVRENMRVRGVGGVMEEVFNSDGKILPNDVSCQA